MILMGNWFSYSSLDILSERFAEAELSKEECEERKQVINSKK